MSTLEILFLVFTIPGIYIVGILLTYKLIRKFLFTDEYEKDDARVFSAFWVFTIPCFIICGGGYWILHAIFDMIDGDK